MIGKFKFVIEASNMGPTIIWAKTQDDAIKEFESKYPAATDRICYTNKAWLVLHKKPKAKKPEPVPAPAAIPVEGTNAEL